ncbi:MAG TPA: lamin tail domain-containing protein [Sedimentisphaerales bacterium]|nr:lamin tail domain-containing protein [Sedimentisphaerales bacterium]
MHTLTRLPLVLLIASFFLVPCAAVEPEGDFDGDNRVNAEDLARLADRWLDPDCASGGCDEDIDGEDGVNARDLAVFAQYWGAEGINLVISEFMAKNKYYRSTTIQGQAVYPDWIELYNPGPDTIYVGGWYLTDDEDCLNKWPLPARWIGAGGRWLIYASDIQIEDHPENSPYYDGTYFHTNFELDGEGEYLALVDPHLYVIHAYDSSEYGFNDFGYPAQQQDASYGLYDGEEQYFPSPTPGTGNTAGYAYVSGVPYFSHQGGTFVESLALTLSTPAQGAVIRYTTNGAIPTGTSTQYTAPITLTATTEIIARLFEPFKAPGPFVTRTYVALDSSVGSVNSDIPLVVVDTYGVGINESVYTKCSAVFIEQPINGARVQITNLPDFAGRCGIRIRGSSTGGQAKHQYSFETWDEHNGDDAASILGMPADADWVLYAPYIYDTALINNALAYEMSRRVGPYACRTRACEVYLNTGGGQVAASHYFGLYYFMEKIRTNDDRVDIDPLRPWDSVEPVISGGYILAIDRQDPDGAGFYTSRGTGLFTYVDPQEPEVTTAQRTWIRNWLNQLETVLYGTNFADPDLGYAKYMDVASHIDHSLINLLPMNVDAFRLSGYMAKHRNGKLEAGPVWDFDRAFESTDSRDDNPYAWNGTGDATRFFEYVWYGRLHQDIDFWQRYIDRWYELRQDAFNTNNLNSLIDELADEVREASARNYAKWPGAPPRYGGFQGEINNIKTWLSNRATWIDAQFVKPPTMTPNGGHLEAGGSLTLQNPNASGTIYYTIDGSDPRIFRGSDGGRTTPGDISPNAIQYTGPITLNKSTRINARVLVSSNSYSPWSGLATAGFGITPVAQNLRITEIMYHPIDTGDPEDPNREYIELRNIGHEQINLNLVRFTNGIDFTFGDVNLPLGEHVIVACKRSALEGRGADYGDLIAGEYTGKLDNDGDKIRLEDAAEQTILDFEYEDGWREITDGEGYSLTIIDPNDMMLYGSDDGLVAYWTFDDMAGTTVTDSVGANHGQIEGTPIWTAGAIAGALEFEGKPDAVTVNAIEPLTGSRATVQAWVRPVGVARIWNPIFTQHDTAGQGYFLYIYANKPTFSVSDGAATAAATGPDTIVPNEWCHIAGTNDGSSIRLYIDGELVASATSVGFTGADHYACIGYDYTGPSHYFGVIDDMRIYNRAVSQYEFMGMTDAMERWSRKFSWRPSTYEGGSIGYDDSGIMPDPGSIVINEILAHAHAAAADWIELHNTTDDQIDIGGWYLSDTDEDLKKYRIADGTEIEPYGYIVFYEDSNFGQFAADPGKITAFAFSENGDELHLTCADGNDVLTGYRDVETFGASPTGVSFGRYEKTSSGNANFVLLDSITPGAPNAYPKVGPIVISEIMYNPLFDNQDEEFIELLNITSESVTMYDFDTGEAWKFTDGVSYTLPGLTLSAGGRAVLAKDLNAYINAYGMPPWGVFILGPYSGRLDNSGEKLDLSMPGDIDEHGVRQYIRVDRVNYSDGTHSQDNPGYVDLWPQEGDGAGASIVRANPALYGNDPNNWIPATPPTPGLP